MINKISLLLLLFYKRCISPILGNRCRFYPTCSDYAVEALKNFSFFKALQYILWRLVRCAPWSKGGVDFIPIKSTNDEKKKEIL